MSTEAIAVAIAAAAVVPVQPSYITRFKKFMSNILGYFSNGASSLLADPSQRSRVIYSIIVVLLIFLATFSGIFAGPAPPGDKDIRAISKEKAIFIGFAFFIFMFMMVILGVWIMFCRRFVSTQWQMWFLVFIVGIFVSLVATLAYAKEQILDTSAISESDLKSGINDPEQSRHLAFIIMLAVYFVFFTLLLGGFIFFEKKSVINATLDNVKTTIQTSTDTMLSLIKPDISGTNRLRNGATSAATSAATGLSTGRSTVATGLSDAATRVVNIASAGLSTGRSTVATGLSDAATGVVNIASAGLSTAATGVVNKATDAKAGLKAGLKDGLSSASASASASAIKFGSSIANIGK